MQKNLTVLQQQRMEKQQLGGWRGGNYQSFCLSEDRVARGVASRVADCHHISSQRERTKSKCIFESQQV